MKLTKIELPSPHHLYWPELDIDLALQSLDHSERYPLFQLPLTISWEHWCGGLARLARDTVERADVG